MEPGGEAPGDGHNTSQVTSTSSTADPATSYVDAPVGQSPKGAHSAPATSTLRRVQTIPREAHQDSKGSSSDYFSSKAELAQSMADQESSKPFTLRPKVPSDPKQFIEAARNELYGSSAAYDRQLQTHVVSGPTYNVTNMNAAGETYNSRRTSVRAPPVRSNTDQPTYPNQALAALHSQVHFPRAIPRLSHFQLRNPSSSHSIPTVATPSGSYGGKITRRTSKTTPNSPAQTPGLFPLLNAQQPHLPKLNLQETVADGNDEQSSFPSSPYLHAVSLQPPRTVTSADRQVDTFSGRKMINHYEIQQELGRGVHGKVKLARDLDHGGEVAIKIVQRYTKRWRLGKAGAPEDKVKKEVAILKKVQHPNVVRLIEVIDDPDIEKVYLVLEYCENKDIKWRKHGTNEIILAEHWRQAAEQKGDPPEKQERQFKNIEDLIRRRRRKEAYRRRQLAKIGRSAEGTESHTWSLEYGPDTDDESYSASEAEAPDSISGTAQGDENTDDNRYDSFVQRQRTANSSIVSDSRPVSSPTEISTTSADPYLNRPSTSFEERRTRESEAAFGTFEDAASLEGYSFYGLERFQEQAPGLSNPSIDETRGLRQPSIAESVASQITQDVENEVPDESRYVPTMSLFECRSAFRDALVGLDYLHYNGIIHRDIKPENLLRTKDRRVKISDFGVSYLGRPTREGEDSGEVSDAEANEFEEETELAKTVGTPAFYAPELCRLDTDASSPVVTKQIDVWALGVTLYCLLFARTPFHAENEYALMKRIWTDEVFIPRRRLKAVDVHARSPGPNGGALFSPDKRLPSQWLHEPIDDDLYDLLTRLFKKAPKERITIKETKHHPWVLKGIQDPAAWLEETDPARIESGKKIEISNQEVAEAVVPINLVQRIKSITKRATSVLGLGGRRNRLQSSATSTSSDGVPIPNTPDQLEKEMRRRSLHTNDSILQTFRGSREKDHEHPLSRSVNASPDPESMQRKLDTKSISTATSSHHSPQQQQITPNSRPGMPDRQVSEISTTGSIRTIRASDVERGRETSISPPSAETPRSVVEPPTPSSLSAILGDASRSFLRSIRSRDRLASASTPSLSTTLSAQATDRSDLPYSEASVAVSNTSASGHMNVSSVIRDKLGDSPRSSPSISRRESEGNFSDGSANVSSSPTFARIATPEFSDRRSRHRFSPADFGGGMSRGAHVYNAHDDDATDEEYRKAIDDLSRRRALQDIQDQEHFGASRSSAPVSQQPCPPSPDDESPQRNRTSGSSSQDYFNSPSSTVFSSEEHFTSEASRSASFPSVPSVVSADSSVVPERYSNELLKTDGSASSEGTYTGTPASPRPFSETRVRETPVAASNDGYTGNGDEDSDDGYAVETDEDDSSDSEDDFLQLGRKKTAIHAQRRKSLHTNTETAESRKSERNGDQKDTTVLLGEQQAGTERRGSTNTVKRVGGDDNQDLQQTEAGK